MSLRTRLAAIVVSAATVVVPVSVATAPAAHADRCEPTEPVIRLLYPTYEEAVDERDSPFCFVMLNYVYPRLCDDSQTLLPGQNGNPGCVRTINPDVNEPVVVFQYSPDGARITCNLTNFVLFVSGQSPAC